MSEKKVTEIKFSPCCVSYIGDIEGELKAFHEEIEIKCFYEGSATLIIGTQTVNVKVGDIVVINPYEFHATIGYGESESRYHRIMVPIDFFVDNGVDELDLRSMLLENHKCFKTKFSNNLRLQRILKRAVKEYQEQGVAWHTATQGLMMEFFSVILRDGLVENTGFYLGKVDKSTYKIVEPALRYIKNNYSENLDVEQLSLLCGVSKYYFCRVFKKAIGKTCMEYIRDYRMRVSKALLYRTDKSITEIAKQCGFESVNYFCRCYKNDYGCSPTEYRRIVRE